MNKQIKSKERVTAFGEVNTSQREVNSMLNLVQQETERLDSRFLEPACGDGNFLIEVLDRKLKVLISQYKKDQHEFEKNSIVIFGSIYGIDILEDNAISAKNRLFEKFFEIYQKYFRKNTSNDFIDSIKFILEKNIIHGDALTLKKVDSEELITFCEWGLVNDEIKRRDFTFKELLECSPYEKGSLFSSPGEDVSSPSPIREYSPVNFMKVFEAC